MKRISDAHRLAAVLEQNDLQSLFSAPLLPMAELLVFEKGEYLYRQGERTDDLYVLVSGRAEVYAYIRDDLAHCQQYFCSCDLIGEADVLWGEPPVSNVLALSRCTCVGISLARWRDTLLADPVFLRAAARALARLLREKSAHTRLLPLEARLSAYILTASNGDVFAMNLKETAELLDASYRHLLRVMAGLCGQGALERVGRGRYRIAGRGLLRALAGTDEQRFP